jgi:hypothetical protein
MTKPRFWLCVLLALLPAAVSAQTQVMDEEFAGQVKQWTTKPEFINPLVDHLPKSGSVPSPKAVLGDHIGAPNVLHSAEQVNGYFRKLAETSPRMRVEVLGKSEEGRDIILAFISSEENIRNLEVNRGYLASLADPRGLCEDEASAIIAKAKPVYHINGGVHAAETGSSETLTELAYRLAVEDSPLIRNIRENAIVAITPVFDPDGRDRVVDWFYRFNTNATDYRNRVPGPPYWGKYIFHDDNRDIMFTGLAARASLAFHLKWHPTVLHDIHETMPYLYIYSGYSVKDPGVDPILFTEMYWLSNFQKMKLVGYGMPGVWDHGTYDIWWPGYIDSIASNHNAVVQMYETFSNNGPNTMLRNIAPPKRKPGEAALPWFLAPDYTARDWRRPLPAYDEVLWSARNTVNYTQTGLLAALELVATHPATLVENFYRKSRNSLAEGSSKAPFAYIIPIDQADLTRVASVVGYLRLQGIEVGEATGAVTVKEGTFPAGSLVVKLNQPYGRFARTLLERQVYTGDSKKLDDTGWTLGIMARVRTAEISDKSVLDVPVRPVRLFEPQGTMPSKPAKFYAVIDHGSNSLTTLRVRLGHVPVRVVEHAFDAAGVTVPAGSLVVPMSAKAALTLSVAPLGLTAIGLAKAPAVPMHDQVLPKLAVFSTWGSTQDVGWVRYAFDQAEVKFDLIYKDQVRAGSLRSKYDVIVVPQQGGGSSKSIVDDLPMTGKPVPYTRTDQFPSLGMNGESPDIRGGMGEEGLRELRSFVEQGGTLITLGLASEIPVTYGWTPGITLSKPSDKFRAIGPVVTGKVDKATSPLFYGYDEPTVAIRWGASSLYEVSADAGADVLLRYDGGPASLQTGEFNSIGEIADRPAVIRKALGQGQLLMFTSNPMFRHQNTGEYRMLFNAILNSGSLAQ